MFDKNILYFTISGILGFCIDAGILLLSIDALGIYESRLLSFICAVVTTWIFNRNITFKNKRSSLPLLTELVSYLSLMCFGGVVNYSIYVFLITRSDLIARYPFIAVALGSLVGMFINFSTSKLILFNKNREV